jgi:putative ATP-binding cassette transporter
MTILRLLKTGNPADIKGALYVTCLAGLANAVLIGLINLVAEQSAQSKPVGARLVLLYLIAFAIYYVANRASLRAANDFLQQRLGELRLRLADKIRRSQLRTLEQLGRGVIYATVAQETNHLSQNFPLLVSAGQSLFLLAFCLLYIATLSLISFVVVTAVTVVALMLFWFRRKKVAEAMVTVNAHEASMLESLTHFTEGFQEIRLNADKNDALFEHFVNVASGLESVVVGIGRNWVVLLLFSNAFLYGLLGVVIFVLPGFFDGYTDIIYKIAAAAIFCVGPVTAVTSVTPLYGRASVGLGHVFRLEERLDQGVIQTEAADPAPSRFRGFQSIAFQEITFSYLDSAGKPSFTAGPWDIELRRPEILFLLGGNGSGKSTALKLLCGLYTPATGRILVDGVAVDDESLQQYRELFSCIFPDFHLFDRLHGLDGVDPVEVRALIERMELGGKVEFADGRFSTQDLSTGQRKRLAMIVSLLEDREIYLFDEWAADQDSHFREVFYTELLPELKQRGKTIIVVTHDDRYWNMSDRVITLDLGVIVPSSAQAETRGA